jgi:hypothetical protein
MQGFSPWDMFFGISPASGPFSVTSLDPDGPGLQTDPLPRVDALAQWASFAALYAAFASNYLPSAHTCSMIIIDPISPSRLRFAGLPRGKKGRKHTPPLPLFSRISLEENKLASQRAPLLTEIKDLELADPGFSAQFSLVQ